MKPRSKALPMRMLLGWPIALASLVGLAGCANVQPYEREHLADPIMQMDEGPQGAYEQHMHRALEGGLAGQPAAGGGCGCEQ
jgi:hypothetical protein